MTNKTNKSCWDCHYYRTPLLELIGYCWWFPEHGKGPQKSLLKAKDFEQVDKGCKFFKKKIVVIW